MGFFDAQRNAIVLKGVNGNLDRAVEALVRLGEGDKRSPTIQEPPRPLRTSRSLTPLTQGSSGLGIGMGLPQKTGQVQQPSTPSSVSTNPFDMMPPAQPQTAQSTGNLQTKNPYNIAPSNPYGVPGQQVDLINQAFQSLDISAPQAPQPLFPHHTGGAASQQASHLMSQQQHVPPVPPSPQAYHQMGFQVNTALPLVFQQQQIQQQTSYNPFLSNATNSPVQQQQLAPQQISLNTAQIQGSLSSNPFARSPTRIASPTLGQIPEQFQATTFQSPAIGQVATKNPFVSSPVQSPAQATNNPFSSQVPAQQQYYYQPQRADTTSIMALYNQSQSTPKQAPTPDLAHQMQTSANSQLQPMTTQSLPVSPIPGSLARSATLPMASSTNPFLNSGAVAAAPDPFASDRKISRESMNLGLDMAWTNGRHSPDAFASLSARHA